MSTLQPCAPSYFNHGTTMDWKVGYKLTHPFNPDWGVGEVRAVGPQGRHITVHFDRTGEDITLSTHAAAFKRWVFPLGSRAAVINGALSGREVTLVERERDEEGHDHYRTEDGAVIREENLRPLGRVAGALERLERLDVDLVEQYENRYAGTVLDLERQVQGLSGIIGGRVTLFPHQLHVAYRVARRHPVRALLADEVGLGKTIEAGMIYSALRQADRAARVLVLTPDALTVQWLGELFRKFHDVFVLMDAERLEDAEQDHPDLSPWQVYPRAVCALPFLTANQLLALDAAEVEGGWDLLIVDEAHHLRYAEAGANKAYEAVEAIAANARNILFLTATPMELDRREYFGLLRLLQPSLFHDLDLFEIQLEEIAQANEIAVALEGALGESPEDDEPEAGREPGAAPMSCAIPVDLPDRVADAFPEQEHLQALAVRAVEGDLSATGRLLTALTNLHPLGDTVFSNTRARVGGFPPRHGTIHALELSPTRQAIYQDVHRWVIEVAGGLLEPRSLEARNLFDFLRLAAGPLAGLRYELMRRRKLAKARATIELFDDLIERCTQAVNEDSARLDALLAEVRSAVIRQEKLLVFVQHVADLEHLRDRIEARVGVRVATFHEKLPATDRDIQVALFRSPEGYPVLLSTEAGGEGRNFQFCHRLVHFDLPPSPNRVEQRIGRLDRIGQKCDVESVVLVGAGTVEHHLATLLDTRIGVFDHTIGGLDPVLEEVGDRVVALALSADALDPSAWDRLGKETDRLLHGARDAITRGLDHLLHRGGFDRGAAEALTEAIPPDLEDRLEEFVVDFCEQTGITVQEKDSHGTYFLALDRYCTLDSLPGVPLGTGYVGTFSRERALEREDYDFFATGHPLLEGIFSFIADTPYGTATLRRYKKTGLRPSVGVQYNYRFEADARGDVDAPVFFPPRLFSVAIDLDGTIRAELLPLLTARYSKAYPVTLDEVQEITRQPGWLSVSGDVAEREARRAWEQAVTEAGARYDRFVTDETARLEAFFEHRLDSADARIAFGRSATEIKVAQMESRSLRREWEARLEQLERRREVFRRGEPVLDSVALYIIEA